MEDVAEEDMFQWTFPLLQQKKKEAVRKLHEATGMEYGVIPLYRDPRYNYEFVIHSG